MKFVWKKSTSDYLYLRVVNINKIEWVREEKEANNYPSRYAAKKHLKVLDNVPATAILYQLN